MTSPIDPFIERHNCPTSCTIFQERRLGKNGPFYFCNRCRHTISEAPRGGIDTPCGVCAICGGLLFWRTLSDGTRFQACWSTDKHGSIFRAAANKPTGV